MEAEASLFPYSPKCVEDEFSEVGIAPVQHEGVLLAYRTGAIGRVNAVGLVLYHRFDWPSRGYGVCVPMHNLPGALFGSKDQGNPQRE